MALTAQNIQISWKPPPDDAAHGIIQGFKILYEPSNTESGEQFASRFGPPFAPIYNYYVVLQGDGVSLGEGSVKYEFALYSLD